MSTPTPVGWIGLWQDGAYVAYFNVNWMPTGRSPMKTGIWSIMDGPLVTSPWARKWAYE